jgi:hypothetical protein
MYRQRAPVRDIADRGHVGASQRRGHRERADWVAAGGLEPRVAIPNTLQRGSIVSRATIGSAMIMAVTIGSA